MEQMRSGWLEWDSRFFGYRVARIDAGDASESEIVAELARYRQQGCRLVYVFSPGPLVLEDFDALLADRKRSYLLTDPRHRPVQLPVVPAQTATEQLYDLACQAGAYSRYWVDPKICREDARRLYRLWLDNSLSRQFADHVLVCESDGRQTGLVTAKIKGPELSIGLIATDSRYRGQGIGGAMVQTIVNLAAQQGLKAEVTTQADNLPACRFYELHGFSIHRQDYVYHLWL